MNETTKVLDAVEKIMNKYLVLPSAEERDAVVVWTAASWVADSAQNFPRLYFRAAEKGSGKSVAAETVGRLTREFHDMVGATPSVLYRLIENAEKPICVFIDECDNIWKQGSGSSHQELLAVLNKGFHRRGKVYRSRGQNDVYAFNCFSPVILAGIGVLPDTILSRSITINMRKPVEGESFCPYRERVHAPFFETVRNALDKWSGPASKKLGTEFPDLPDALSNRDVDLWEHLVAVADLAEGSDWGERIRRAAVKLTGRTDIKESVPPATSLVRVLARMFKDAERVTQEDVAREMGNGITSRSVGKLAREMEFHPSVFKINGKTVRGFTKKQYEEMFHV